MKEIVSTIITKDYGHYALALHDSLREHFLNVNFCVFVSNGTLPQEIENQLLSRQNIILYNESSFNNRLEKKLREKYFTINHDAYRWAMKPLLLEKLMQQGYERAIYVDSDVYFFNDYKFLFDELKVYRVLLSPHWRSSSPNLDLPNFKLNFLDGIYNGGFVGASKGGEPALQYWAELCLFHCEVDRKEGFYVDQRYLDILPTRFEKVGHIVHRGCNVANWNQVDCERILQNDGGILINNKYPVVFIHFTNSLFKGAYLWKNDTELISYIEKYRDSLLKYSNVDVIERFHEKGVDQQSRTENKPQAKSSKSFFNQTIWKVYRKIKRKFL